MSSAMVKVRKHIVNIDHVADAHWEAETLYLHFTGGRFAQLRGSEAELIWHAVAMHAIDLETGEVPMADPRI
jgi:hypothetical protein